MYATKCNDSCNVISTLLYAALDANNQFAVGQDVTVNYYTPGSITYMFGYAPPSGQFTIDFIPQYEPGSAYVLDDAICLRMVVDMDTYHIIRQSFAHGDEWSVQEDDGYSGLYTGRYFTMAIVAQTYSYEIMVNNYHFATYYYRIPITKSMRVVTDANVRLEPIEYYP